MYTVLPTCTFDLGMITAYMPNTITREFYSIEEEVCMFLIITTIDGTYIDGFVAPTEPGFY